MAGFRSSPLSVFSSFWATVFVRPDKFQICYEHCAAVRQLLFCRSCGCLANIIAAIFKCRNFGRTTSWKLCLVGSFTLLLRKVVEVSEGSVWTTLLGDPVLCKAKPFGQPGRCSLDCLEPQILTEEIIRANPAMFTMDLSFVDKASFGVAAREMHTLLAQKMVLQARWQTEESTWSSWIKCFSGRRPLTHLTAAWLWLTQTPQSTRCGPGEACNIGRWISSWLARRAWCRKWFISWTQALSELRINIVKICRVVWACLSKGFLYTPPRQCLSSLFHSKNPY